MKSNKQFFSRLIFKGLCLVLLGWLFLFPAYGQSSFTQGEALFIQNKPQEALQFLEAAVSEDPAHVKAFIYLGIAYQQLNRLDEAIAAYRRILPRAGAETARVNFNLGVTYFAQGNYQLAIQSYNQALTADPTYSAAILNRANAKIGTGALDEAIADYEDYLSLEPRSSQRASIERLIAFIRDEQAAEEARIEAERVAEEQRIEAERVAEEQRIEAERVAEEERRIAEEARIEAERVAEEQRIEAERVAEEERRIAEEARIEAERVAAEERRIAAEEAARREAERRERLLAEVTASLQAAAEDSRSLSAGNENIEGYHGEFELE